MWTNEFNPDQPRDEDGKWAKAGEYATRLDNYAAEYQTEGRVAEAAAATQAALLLRGHNYRASVTVLREAELHRDIPNTHIAIMNAANDAYIAENHGANWGMEAGTYTAWRAGAVTGTPRGVFFSIDKAGADAYGAAGRPTHRYSVDIKNPLVIDRLEPAYAQLTGKSLDSVYAEKTRRDPMKWWRDTDAKIGRLAQAKGYDAIVYTRPAPPAIRELVVFNKKAITLQDTAEQKLNNAVPALDYSLRTTEALGWKVNFDPEQPRDEDGKWTDSGQNYGRPPVVGEDKLPYKTAVRLFYPENRLGEQMEAAEMKRVATERILFRLQSRKTDMKACVDRLTGFVSKNTDGPAYNARLQDTVARLINNWAESSSDHNPLSLAIQVAAQHEFGIAGTDAFIKTRIEALGTGAERSVFDKFNTPEVQEGLRCFLRAQYDETQYHLKQQGVETLTAFRGVVAGDTYKALALVGDNVEVSQNPLSSWSNNVEKALQFSTRGFDQTAGVVMVSTFNRQDVLGMPGRGFGCQDEEEYVVRGGAFRVACVTAPELATEINEARRRGEAEQPVKRVLDILKRQEERVNRLAAKHNTKEPRFHLDKEDENADWIDRSKDVMLNTPHVNAQDEEGNEGRWVTMHGTPVFIKDGEDPKAAMSRTFAKDKPRGTERPRPKQPGAFKRWWREAVSDAKQVLFRKRNPQQETPRGQPVGGKVPNAALQHFPRQVDMVFDGKLSSQQVVDGLMKSGMIRTGTVSRELTRARYVKEFDKAVALMEQRATERQSPGGGKNAYTDKGEKAKLRTGQSLAEKFFAPHIDQLADGKMSVTSKVDELARRGELGVMPDEPGFIKLRETVIKDFTKALNRRETFDRRYEKQRLKTDKPKKLTKREQQAEWTPSEEELAASGPVVGTGWKRNMAENQPRDEQGRWTDGVGASPVTEQSAAPAVARRSSMSGNDGDVITNNGGYIDIQFANTRYAPRSQSIIDFVVNEGVRGQGYGKRLLAEALLKYGDLGGQASSRASVAVMYNAGMRSPANPSATLPDLFGMLAADSSVYMAANDEKGTPYHDTTAIAKPKTNAFDPTQPRDEAGKWSLSGSKLVGALTSLYSAQPTPPADGKGWLRPDGLFIDGGGVSHVAMLRAAYGDRKGKAPAFAEDMYRLAFHAGLARYDRHAGVIEISGAPTEDQKTSLRKMFDGLGTFDEIEVEVFRTPETRYYSEQDGGSHRRWMETSPDSMVEKVDAFYGSKGDGYVSPLAAFRGNAFDPNQPRDEDGKWTDGGTAWSWGDEAVNEYNGPETAFAQSLPQADRDLLQNYYTAGTEEVNGALRNKRTLDGKAGEAVKLLDKAFLEAPALPAPLILYRVVPLSVAEEWMGGADERGIVGDRAFVSTTISESAISNLQEDLDDETFVFEIKVPAGAKALPLAGLSGGHFTWQQEYLLPRNSRFHDNGDGTLTLVTAANVHEFKANAFDPNQPRDTDGKWTGGALNFDNEPSRVGGFTKDVAVRRSTVMKGEERVTTWHNPDGSQITDPKLVARAEQLNGTMATAPNVKGAWLNPDTESPLLAIAFDSKDRKQYIYSREFVQKNAEAKFKIVEQMEKDLPVMRKQAAADRKAGTPEAFLFKLEDLTCIRVGSDRDTGAEKKAYGLTTLRGEHVKVEGDLIKLEFPAKGGESGSYTVKDRELATFITERKAANGDGPLWPDVTAGKFNAYLKGLDPTTDTPVTAHKFRHYHATRIAAEVVARYEGEELNPKAFTRVQREACEKAAAHLSNTWTVTREKYVNPTVWGRLTVKAG